MQGRGVLFIALGVLGAACPVLQGAESAAPEPSTTTLHAVEFIGNAAVPDAVLEKRLSIRPSDPFKPEQVEFSRQVIESVYRDRGYAEAQASTRTISVAPGRVDLQFHIEEGPLYRVRSVKVRGNRFLSGSRHPKGSGHRPGRALQPGQNL